MRDLKGPTIVAVGASAEGLEALHKLLEKLPKDPGMAFIFLQHLDPNYNNLTLDILTKNSSLKVEEAKDNTQVLANHIYFIPSNTSLSLVGNTLKMAKPKQDHGHRTPIDLFFRSLAESKKEKAIGIVMRGNSSDGSIGIKAIKESGGLTIAEDPDNAAFSSMPVSAINTGMVDHILPKDKIFPFVLDFVAHQETYEGDEQNETYTKEAEDILGPVCKYFKKKFKHNFTEYKRNTLIRRIHRRMQIKKIHSGLAYFDVVESSYDEAKALYNDFLIGVTYFFRDSRVFEYIKSNILSDLVDNSKEGLRFWVPGCASGEEAYSYAILIHELMTAKGIDLPVQIFASDVDERGIDAARQAEYSQGIVENVSQERLEKFFDKKSDTYVVKKFIREMCLFSKHDITQDPPFSRLDLVSCRNLLIYMGPELQRSTIRLFNFALNTGAYLVLGPTENPKGRSKFFEVVQANYKVFKNRAKDRSRIIRFGFHNRTRSFVENGILMSDDKNRGLEKRDKSLEEEIDSRVFSAVSPPFVIVNRDQHVEYYSGNLEGILSPAKGRPDQSLVQMVRAELRVKLRTALIKAINDEKMVIREKVQCDVEEDSKFYDIIVKPFEIPGQIKDCFSVVFQRTPFDRYKSKKKPRSKNLETDNYIELEEELVRIKEQLQATIEELEHANEELKSSNEELLSMNEEMQSGNEELQSSHEEMQSVNEELEAVNSELAEKVSLLDQANSDLENFFRSTEVATLFVDSELRIKRFTPKAKEVFGLIDSDIKRPLTDLSSKFDDLNIGKELSEVLETLQPIEKIVKLHIEEKWYQVQIHPYRTTRSAIDGATVSLHEISELVDSREQISARLEQQTLVAHLSLEALDGVLSEKELFDIAVKKVSDVFKVKFCKILLYDDEKDDFLLSSGVGWKDGLVGSARIPAGVDSQAGYTLYSDHPIVVNDLQTEKRFSGPELLFEHGIRSGVSVSIGPSKTSAFGVLGIHTSEVKFFSDKDIGFLQSVANVLATYIEKQKLKKTKRLFQHIFNSSPEVMLTTSADRSITSWNPAAESILGFSQEEALGKDFCELIVPDKNRDESKSLFDKIIDGQSFSGFETERRTKSGRIIPMSVTFAPIQVDNNVTGIISISRDITEKKRSEEALRHAKLEADAANNLKSRFMGVLSHELRTPLAAILGYSELLSKDSNFENKNSLTLEKIKENGLLLQNLVKDILDVSKVEQGKVVINNEWFNLRRNFEGFVSAMGVKASKTNVDFRFQFDDAIPENIYTDSFRLHQILGNLISNGIKYSDEGEVFVEFSLLQKKKAPKQLVVRVKDSGRGIPKETRKDLFKPFFRAEPSKGAPGVGLGLYLSHNLAYALGGRLRYVDNESTKGAEFELRLPIKTSIDPNEGQIPMLREESILTGKSLAGLRVLVAEDSEDLRNIIVAFLALEGAKVVATEDGLEAWEKLQEEKFDLVLLDLYMPEMNGYDIAFKMDQAKIKIPKIVLTAHAMKDVKEYCLEKGFDSYLSKPVSQEGLIKAILNTMEYRS